MDSNDDNVAVRLRRLSHFLQEKNKRLEALLQLFTRDPTLPIEAMVREYGSALDSTDGHDYLELVKKDLSADDLDHRQRSARTKRIRTRERLISTATSMVIQREPFRLADLAEVAGMSVATIHHHFRTKDELLWAVYDRLLQPILDPTTEGS
jgi:AraC-like DNA-binding protein